MLLTWEKYLVDKVEGVQRNFTKRIPGLKDLAYKERLLAVGLAPLEIRRLRLDLCEVYKIAHGMNALKFHDFFVPSPAGQTRGHNAKIEVPMRGCEIRNRFFANRVIQPWNSLSQKCVSSGSLSSFKSNLENEDLARFVVGSWSLE
jgi:hypothetical protein